MKFDNKLINTPFSNVFLFSLSWALSILTSKLAFNAGAHPVSYLIQVMVFSMIFLSLYVVPTKYEKIKSISLKVLLMLLAINVLHGGLSGFFRYIGTALTSATNVGFLGKTALVPTIIFAWLILGEKINFSKIISALVMIVGVFFLTTGGKWIIPQSGDIFMILAGVTVAFANVMVRNVVKNKPIDSEIIAWLRPIAGLPVLLIVTGISPIYPKYLQSIFSVDLLNISYIYYVVVNSVFSSLLVIFLYRTLKVASASYMTMMSMMNPVMVSLLAMVFLKEKITSMEAFGGLLIIISGIATHYLRIDKH